MDWTHLGVVEFTTPAIGRVTVTFQEPRPSCAISMPSGEIVTVEAFFDGRGFTARARSVGPGTYRGTFYLGGQHLHDAVVKVDGTTMVAPVVAEAGGPDHAAPVLCRQGADEPMLWVADTWWYALSSRLPASEMGALLDRRRQEGFNVVQLVAGLYPEATAGDILSISDGHWSWTPELSRLDPDWWSAADARLAAMVAAGFVPAIVGAWSYYLLDLGEQRMRAHWSEVVARWASLPVVWCVAGEAGLPHYADIAAPDIDRRVADLTTGWRAIADHVRQSDPYRNLLTVHPCPAFGHYSSLDVFTDPSAVDLVWLQTGHADRGSVPNSLDALETVRRKAPHVPVVNSEVCYEGIAGGSSATIQRFLFWANVLSGAAGHTYGAQGLWAFAVPGEPSPGVIWGAIGWRDAANLDGARHVGAGADVLRALPWWTLTPNPAAAQPHASTDNRFLPYCAHGPDLVVLYSPAVSLLPPGIGISLDLQHLELRALSPGSWTFDVVDPRTASVVSTDLVEVGIDGTHVLATAGTPTPFPTLEDWLLIGRRSDESRGVGGGHVRRHH